MKNENWMNLPELEYKALRYAEKHGLFYHVEGENMIWTEYWGAEGTYEIILDLNTMKEISRRKMNTEKGIKKNSRVAK